MKRKILLIYVLALTIIISGCMSNSPIKVGFVGTLSGSASNTAIAGKRGAEMAIDVINSSGGVDGRMIELVVKDSLNDSKIAKKVAEEFIEDNIQYVIGDFTSNLTENALEIIDGKDILYLSPTASSSIFQGKDDNLLRFTGNQQAMVEAIYSQMAMNGDKNVIILKDENNKAYVDSFSKDFESVLANMGGAIIDQVYFDGMQEIDESNIISTINGYSEKYDGILLLANAPGTASLTQMIRTNEINSNIYTSGWSNTPNLLTLGGSYIEGIHTIGPIDYESNSVKYIEFSDLYIEYYGEKPTAGAMFAYDSMMALYKGLLDSRSVKAQDVKKTIIDIGIVEGLQDTFQIDEYGDSTREYIPFIIINGEIIRFNLDENK